MVFHVRLSNSNINFLQSNNLPETLLCQVNSKNNNVSINKPLKLLVTTSKALFIFSVFAVFDKVIHQNIIGIITQNTAKTQLKM
jgi:hypothetical protein